MGNIWLLTFDILILAVSIFYFFIYSNRHYRFIMLWAHAWIVYAIAMACFVLYSIYGCEEFLIARKLLDMINIVLLLWGTYAYMHVKTPRYWFRITLYLSLLALICSIYKLYMLSVYLPLSIYQTFITVIICYNILKNWNVERSEKTIYAIAFFMWGMGKAVFSIIEIFSNSLSDVVFAEFTMFVLVSFSIFMVISNRFSGTAELKDNIYKQVVENSADAIFYYKIRPFAAFEYISPAIEKITGYNRNFFYGNPKFLEEIADKEYLEQLTYMLGVDKHEQDSLSAQLYNRQGNKIWVEISCSPITDDNGEITALQGVIRDITDVKNAEVEQINMNRNRNMLFTYISHELRTPITSIAGYAAAINDGTFSTPEEKQEALDVISAKVTTLKKLVDDIDQLSKLETDQFKFDFEAYNVAELTEMLISANVTDAQNKGFKVEVDASLKKLEKYWIIADSARIQQVVMNLINNAIKYSDDRKNLKLSFKVDEAEINYIVSIKDSGTGIKSEDLPLVFDRFYRTEYNRGREGRGLGLTLCREIIEKHQGNIYVESVYGEGSTFTFIIPLYKES